MGFMCSHRAAYLFCIVQLWTMGSKEEQRKKDAARVGEAGFLHQSGGDWHWIDEAYPADTILDEL